MLDIIVFLKFPLGLIEISSDFTDTLGQKRKALVCFQRPGLTLGFMSIYIGLQYIIMKESPGFCSLVSGHPA